MKEKINQNQEAREAADNHNARSFLNYYQQYAEYESTLKVKRLEKDFQLYTQEQTFTYDMDK